MIEAIELLRSQHELAVTWVKHNIAEEVRRLARLRDGSKKKEIREIEVHYLQESQQLEWISDRATEHKHIDAVVLSRDGKVQVSVDNGADSWYELLEDIDNLKALLGVLEDLLKVEVVEEIKEFPG